MSSPYLAPCSLRAGGGVFSSGGASTYFLLGSCRVKLPGIGIKKRAKIPAIQNSYLNALQPMVVVTAISDQQSQAEQPLKAASPRSLLAPCMDSQNSRQPPWAVALLGDSRARRVCRHRPRPACRRLPIYPRLMRWVLPGLPHALAWDWISLSNSVVRERIPGGCAARDQSESLACRPNPEPRQKFHERTVAPQCPRPSDLMPFCPNT